MKRVKKHRDGGQHQIGIRTLFLRMILASGITVAAVVLGFILVFWYLQFFGIIVSPSVREKNMAALLQDISMQEEIVGKNLPVNADYAIFDLDGNLLETNLPEKEVEEARKTAALGEDNSYGQLMSKWYRLAKTKTQVCVLQYYVRAEFSIPSLRRIFPNAELVLFGLLFLSASGDIVLIVVHYTRKVTRQIAVMEKAAEGIKSRDLDFQVEYTGIREFNRVLSSLDELKESLARSLGAQWKLEQMKKEQMAALAHDIKTPLTVISGNVQLLKESGLDEEQQEYAGFIEKNAEQMRSYIAQLIEISRGGVKKIVKKRTDVKELLAELEKRAQERLAVKKQHLEFSAQNLPADVPADAEMLLRGLMNIVDNAAEYTPEGGKVSICIAGKGVNPENPRDAGSIGSDKNSGRYLQFCVRDQGRGFTPEELKLARLQFFRKDDNRNSANHFGLGLYIADEAARAHGGHLLLANNRDAAGALVTFEIPYGAAEGI